MEKANTVKKLGDRISRDGYGFDPASMRWKLSRDVEISLEQLRGLASGALLSGFVSALAECAQTHSAKHAANMYYAFCFMLRRVRHEGAVLNAVTATEVLNFKAQLDKRTEHRLGRLVGFFTNWSTSRYPGLHPEVVPLLNEWKLVGNPKGEAVALRCPLSGPLTAMEFSLFQERAIDAFEDGKLDLEDFVLVRLFAASGRRPAQLADGKWLDFTPPTSAEGLGLLKIPRRKGKGSGFRKTFKTLAMDPELNLAFLALREESYSRARSILPILNEGTLGHLPLFPDWRKLREYQGSSASVIDSMAYGEALHSRSDKLGSDLSKAVTKLSVTSDRVSGAIRVSPVRLRRTLATRAAREGYSVLIIAELLDHEDTQNAKVYTENVPENLDPINDAVANQIAPIMRAFRGEIVASEEFAARAADKRSRIRTGVGTLSGSCGQCGTCTARAPVACYTCRAFQPWLDGDHNAVLDILLQERGECTDMTIAEACDLAIFAVREVIMLCTKIRNESMKGAAE